MNAWGDLSHNKWVKIKSVYNYVHRCDRIILFIVIITPLQLKGRGSQFIILSCFLPRIQCRSSASILSVLQSWFTSLDSHSSSCAVFFALKKAFDSVPHQCLLNTLSSMNIPPHLLCWFRSYLTNRTQLVLLSGSYSPKVHVLSGVPQGFILGPPLIHSLYQQFILSSILPVLYSYSLRRWYSSILLLLIPCFLFNNPIWYRPHILLGWVNSLKTKYSWCMRGLILSYTYHALKLWVCTMHKLPIFSPHSDIQGNLDQFQWVCLDHDIMDASTAILQVNDCAEASLQFIAIKCVVTLRKTMYTEGLY